MKNNVKKIIVCIVVLILAFGGNHMQTQAAESATVSISSASGDVGDQVTVNINVESSGQEIYMCDLYVTYDSTVLQVVSGQSAGGGGTIRLLSTESTSFSVTFKALKAGNSSIKLASNSIVSSEIEDALSVKSANGSVTVNSSASTSSNNNLTSLKIAESTLSPEFSKDVTIYTAAITQDVTKLTISAIAEDSNATVKVTGTKMDPGKNTTTIRVTAENGETKSYIIYTTMGKDTDNETGTDVVDAPTALENAEVQKKAIATIGGVEYYIISDFDKTLLPAGYESEIFDYKGQTVLAAKGLKTKLTIMYVEKVDGTADGVFCVYDTTTDTFYQLNMVTSPEIRYTVLPIADDMELIDGYTKSSKMLNEEKADVLIKSGGIADYCLFYGIDEDGNTGWFRYEYTNQTVQKYFEDGSAVEASTNDIRTETDEIRMWRMMTFCIAAGALVLLVIVIALLCRNSQNNERTLKIKNKQKKVNIQEIAEDIGDDAEYRDIENGSAFEDIDEEDTDFEFLDIEDLDE